MPDIRFLILLMFCVGPHVSIAQYGDLTPGAYLEQFRSNRRAPIEGFFLPKEEDNNPLLTLVPYLKDTSVLVRSKAYELTRLIGLNAKKHAIRQDAVSELVEAIKDPHTRNVGQALEYLTDFEKADFSSMAKDSLLVLLAKKCAHYGELVKLIGYLQLTSARDDLRAIAHNTKSPRTERWASLLALARMGDTYAIDDIIARIRRFPVNDEVVYQIFPDLVYTRQRPLLEILIQALNSDDRNCESANADNTTKIPCGYRIMEMLAPAIEGYPYKLDESGDLNAGNYQEALITIRDWFKANPEYKILTDRY